MKRLLLAAGTLLVSISATAADDLKLFGSVAYDDREYDASAIHGIEERVTLGWQRTFFTPLSLRLLFRGDNFRGSNDFVSGQQNQHTQQIQPVGELTYAVSNFFVSTRYDYLKNRAEQGDTLADRSVERTSFIASWAREKAPTLSMTGQRQHINEPFREIDDENIGGSVAYTFRSLNVGAMTQKGRSLDVAAGFDRTSIINGALLDWHSTFLQNRVAANFSGTANVSTYDQRALNSSDTSVPFPVTPARALYAIDETPADGRDQPLVPYPALIDGSLNTAAGVDLGPDGVSYQNLVLDIGRNDTLDEIRLIVRDDRGNPVKRVGAVSFDVYTSEDGQLWTPLLSAHSSFDVAVSYYSVLFDATRSRWFKVVTFGVNPEPVFVTEMQAYFHRTLPSGQNRTTNQRLFTGQTGLSVTPVRRLAIHYGGFYNGQRFNDAGSPTHMQNDVQHEIGADVTLNRGFTTGAFMTQHDIESTALATESDHTVSAYVRGVPSHRFEASVDVTRRDSEHGLESDTTDTVALHTKVRPWRSLNIAMDVGQDTVTSHVVDLNNKRNYIYLTADAQLYPSLRALFVVTSSHTTLSNADEAGLLGRRDDRVYLDLAWTQGRALLVRARYGWLSSALTSGITQQYFVEWNPLEGGAIVISGSHEEDFDPTTDRRARRTTIRPQWFISRFASLDVNYFLAESSFGPTTRRQRTIYAALNLTRK